MHEKSINKLEKEVVNKVKLNSVYSGGPLSIKSEKLGKR